MYGKPNNGFVIDAPGFTRFSRDGTNLESTTTYSRSCVWMTVSVSGTSLYSGPSLRVFCPALGDESASGTPTTGAVSLLLNALVICFRFQMVPEFLRSAG
ncbi:hypothetical protein ILYODFUR_037697 [Ilyodon furcidens]|uniref:Uncharacterized protein n=1 Tax=Ilyodon furcidens TaxID=33524 RepID=A0ABV0UDN0_9TELE